MSLLDAIVIKPVIAELIAERNPAFVTADEILRAEGDSPQPLVADLALLLWRPNQRVACGSPRYESMLEAIARAPKWRRMRAHFQEVQQQISKGEEKVALTELAEMFCFVVKSMVCRLVHFCSTGTPDLNELVETYFTLDSIHEPILNDDILVVMELTRRAKLARYLPQWIDQELIQACLGSVRERSRHRDWPLNIRLEDGMTDERLPGNFSGSRGVTVKMREDQIPDILPPEWRYCDVDRDMIAGMLPREEFKDDDEYNALIDASKDALDKFGINYVSGKCLVLERHRQNRVDVQQRILVPLIIGAEARNQRRPEMEAQVRARRLAFEFLLTAAMKIPARIEVDIAWFEQRDEQWVGNAFPLRALACADIEGENWVKLVMMDSVLPHFFLRWATGCAPKRFDCETIREYTPSAYLERQLGRVPYHAVSLIALMREDELSRFLPSPILSMPQTDNRAHTVLLATVSGNEHVCRGASVRDLVAAAVVSLPLPVVSEDELVRKFVSLLFGPLMAGNRRSF